MSRSLYPKQFLPLVNENSSMLQDTCSRLRGLNAKAPLIICGEDHRSTVAEQMRVQAEMGKSAIVLEPVGRNTAPAIVLAACML